MQEFVLGVSGLAFLGFLVTRMRRRRARRSPSPRIGNEVSSVRDELILLDLKLGSGELSQEEYAVRREKILGE